MNLVPTSVSLLDRLNLAPPDVSDWNRPQGADNAILQGKARILQRSRAEAGDLLK